MVNIPFNSNDNEKIIDYVKETLEKKFPSYEYVFKKPLFDKRYLKVLKDNFSAVVITASKNELKVKGFEANVFSRSLSKSIPLANAVIEPGLSEFERQIGAFLQQHFMNKGTIGQQQIISEVKKETHPEDHRRYMPK